MAEKNFKTRVLQKHDLEVNWNKATNFIPLSGELIIYDPDTTYPYPRFKVGDGKTTVINLPFSCDPTPSAQFITWEADD